MIDASSYRMCYVAGMYVNQTHFNTFLEIIQSCTNEHELLTSAIQHQ